jgi:hypothetical protein
VSCAGLRTPAIAALLLITTLNQLPLVAPPLTLPNRPVGPMLIRTKIGALATVA